MPQSDPYKIKKTSAWEGPYHPRPRYQRIKKFLCTVIGVVLLYFLLHFVAI